MDFQLNAEQTELTTSVRRLLEKTYEFEARKKIIASDSGHSAAVWAQLAEMGVMGLVVPESRGGYASGADVAANLAPILHVMGETLCLEPLIGHLVSAYVLSHCKSDAMCEALLAQMVSGQACVSLSFVDDESSMHGALTQGAMQATHHLIISDTVNSNGCKATIYKRDNGITYSGICRAVDNTRAAKINISKAAAHVLAPASGDITSLCSLARDLQTLLACAEAVGGMRYACDATLEYLKTRKQFGQALGAFQALQHRMVDMVNEWELARGMVDMACARFDVAARGEITSRERENIVSAAKIKVSDAARLIGQESIQLHGGMGMANEMKVSHTFKRLTLIAQLFGDVDYHLARFAATQ
jgi:alkylation response protein AidB-like acyl-CoA dehydrogenase